MAVALTLLIDPACKTWGEALRTVTETLAPVTISEAQQRTVLCYIRSLRRQFVDPEDNGAQGLCIAGKHGRSISRRMPSTAGNSKAAR